MTPEELRLTSALLILAGSETSATCLSGAIYYPLKHTVWMTRLQDELQTTFKDEQEVYFRSVSHVNVEAVRILGSAYCARDVPEPEHDPHSGTVAHIADAGVHMFCYRHDTSRA